MKLGAGPTAASPAMPYQAGLRTSRSPSTSDFQSPTFTYASLDSDEVMSDDAFSVQRDVGDTYNRQAAVEQRRKIDERNAGACAM